MSVVELCYSLPKQTLHELTPVTHDSRRNLRLFIFIRSVLNQRVDYSDTGSSNKTNFIYIQLCVHKNYELSLNITGGHECVNVGCWYLCWPVNLFAGQDKTHTHTHTHTRTHTNQTNEQSNPPPKKKTTTTNKQKTPHNANCWSVATLLLYAVNLQCFCVLDVHEVP